MNQENLYYATGRRKTGFSRTWIKPGSGEIIIINRPVEDYFPIEATREEIFQLFILNSLLKCAINFLINNREFGGGNMPVNKIDLNSDVGESFGNYKLGMDEDIIPLISSANIACGFHAGDPSVMRRCIAIARENGVAIGAHPGYPALIGFGRRNMDASLEEIKDYVTYQVGAIQAFALSQDMKLQHVKPHGALYTMAVQNPEIWDAVAEAIAALDKNLILFVLSGSNRSDLEAIGAKHGIRIGFEFFGDRAYNRDGSLVSRKEPGAVIHDHEVVAEKVLKMVQDGKVVCRDGSEIDMAADTICVHGDNPSALALVKNIRQALVNSGVEIAPPADFL